MTEPKHAFIVVKDGTCVQVIVDLQGNDVNAWVCGFIREGATVVYVPIEHAKGALFEPWPPVGEREE